MDVFKLITIHWRTLILLLLYFSGLNDLLAASYPVYPKPQLTGDRQKDALILRGEYLAKVGDCIACHTNPKDIGQPFAGGLGIKTPFGTMYSPNITPDPSTGIGQWTDAQFIRAMQHGIAPNGHYYYPAFPFVDFSKVNQDDLLAIKAYLFSITPIKKPNYSNEMIWPFNWRFLQLGWRILFFRPAEFKPDPTQSGLWNRGAYLVQGLGHCGMCHTPLNPLGAEEKRYYLTGGFIEGYYAPNITAARLKNISTDEIVRVFTEGKKLNGAGMIGGPMAEVNRDSLQYLTQEDLKAIAVYLKTVESQQPKIHTGPITENTGKKIYLSYCAVCHDGGSAGAPKVGDPTQWKDRIAAGIPVIYQHAINGLNSMPAKGTCGGCSDAEIKATVDFMLTQSKPGNARMTRQLPLVSEPELDLKIGQRIYEHACAQCHSSGDPHTPQLGDRVAWSPLIQKDMETLIKHTVEGYERMPEKGGCPQCSNAQIKAAVKYLVEQSKAQGDYSLW
jgi:cytochrome c5